ncbi:MAG: response regulator [Pseudomonadales bacterium]|nr:response regulator [Pseudomonadales bacterium]
MQNESIYIVEDNPSDMLLMSEVLKGEGYRVSEMISYEELLSALDLFVPDMILLDINLPRKSGYDICCELRENSRTIEVPIVFVSSYDTAAEKIRALEVGGSDYITKPIDAQWLISKVIVNFEQLEKAGKLTQKVEDASETAMTAIRQAAEYGILINVMPAIHQCDDYETLAKTMLDNTFQYGFECAMRIRTWDGTYLDVHCSGEPKPLEFAAIENAQSKGSIVSHKKMTFFNARDVYLFIKNMPTDDPDRNGRVKDILNTLLSSLDARVQVLHEQQRNASLRENAIECSMSNVSKTIRKIETNYSTMLAQSMEVLDDLMVDMNDSLLTLGLTDDQEDAFIKLLETSQREIAEVYHKKGDLNLEFEELVQSIDLMRKGE